MAAGRGGWACVDAAPSLNKSGQRFHAGKASKDGSHFLKDGKGRHGWAKLVAQTRTPVDEQPSRPSKQIVAAFAPSLLARSAKQRTPWADAAIAASCPAGSPAPVAALDAATNNPSQSGPIDGLGQGPLPAGAGSGGGVVGSRQPEWRRAGGGKAKPPAAAAVCIRLLLFLFIFIFIFDLALASVYFLLPWP